MPWSRKERPRTSREAPADFGAKRIQMHSIEIQTAFINWYEILGVPPDANDETLKRVFHLVASRFHPDNQDSGDLDRFLNIKTRRAFHPLLGGEGRGEGGRKTNLLKIPVTS